MRGAIQFVEIGTARLGPLAQSALRPQGRHGQWGCAGADPGYEDAAGESGGVGSE